MKAYDMHRAKLIEFLSDPDNDFPNRSEMALLVLGYKEISSMYKVFTKEQLTEIEQEGLAERRKRYAPVLSEVDKAMFREAKLGNHNAAKLMYERIEGPVAAHTNDDLNKPTPVSVVINVEDCSVEKEDEKESVEDGDK